MPLVKPAGTRGCQAHQATEETLDHPHAKREGNECEGGKWSDLPFVKITWTGCVEGGQ